MRLSIAAVVCLAIVGVAVADPAFAALRKSTNIPAQELGSALQALAQEHDVQVVYLSDGVDKLRTAGAVGEFTADEALKKLLKGTGLSYQYLDEKTITVRPPAEFREYLTERPGDTDTHMHWVMGSSLQDTRTQKISRSGIDFAWLRKLKQDLWGTLP